MEDFKKALKMIEIALYVNVAKLVHSSQKSLVMKLLKKIQNFDGSRATELNDKFSS